MRQVKLMTASEADCETGLWPGQRAPAPTCRPLAPEEGKYSDAEPTVADHQSVRSIIRRELPAAGYSGERENSLAGLATSIDP